jgi:hypothetical protein
MLNAINVRPLGSALSAAAIVGLGESILLLDCGIPFTTGTALS